MNRRKFDEGSEESEESDWHSSRVGEPKNIAGEGSGWMREIYIQKNFWKKGFGGGVPARRKKVDPCAVNVGRNWGKRIGVNEKET